MSGGLRLRARFGAMRANKSAGGESSPAPPSRAPAIIVALSIAAIVALTLWYLVQPQPLLVQGEADATRIDIAARVDGRVASGRVHRGQDVAGRPGAGRRSTIPSC